MKHQQHDREPTMKKMPVQNSSREIAHEHMPMHSQMERHRMPMDKMPMKPMKDMPKGK
jgi:hypothetical protein